MTTGTIGEKHDFDFLHTLNRDSDQTVLSDSVGKFIEFARAVLSRIPSDWTSYFSSVPADLHDWISRVDSLLMDIARLQERPIGERSARIHQAAPVAQGLIFQPINSQLALMELMAIGDELYRRGGGYEQQMRDLTNTAREQVEQVDKVAEKVRSLLASTEQATAAAAASGRARLFAVEATSQDKQAYRWLGASAVLLGVLIIVAILFALGDLLPRPAAGDNFALTNYVLGKVLILGAITYALTFSTRQYATLRHNATMNRHRSHALRTYRAIVEASRGENAHDIILTEAAEAIFTPQDSGFIKGASSEPAGVVQVIQGLLKAPPPSPGA